MQTKDVVLLMAVAGFALGAITAPALAAKPPNRGKPVKPPPSADLSLTITESLDPVTASDEITYEVSVANAGPSATSFALDISLYNVNLKKLTLPPYTDCNVSADDFGWYLECTSSWLGSGFSAPVTLVVTPKPVAIVLGAEISGSVIGSQTDPVPENNQDSESTTVLLGTP